MLPILFRDKDLVAIHKPAGLLVHRSELDRRETRFAVQLLRDQIGQRVYPIHRLDRGTSGVLLFALNAESARAIGLQFEAQRVHKDYLAVVRGHPPQEGCIDHPLSRQRDPAERGGDNLSEEAQTALTHYRRLGTTELPFAVDRYPTSRYALLHLEPATGRRHQLRRHLKHISHPIIGDATHGKGRHNRFFAERYDCHRMLLACVGMSLTHPVSGIPLSLTAPVDGAFGRLVKELGWSNALPSPWLSQDQANP